MGLDMYLNKHIYIGANYPHNKVEATIKIKQGDREIPIDTSKVTYIVERAGYWRKANQIHAWFVKNVQDGVDDCKEYYVDQEKLLELRDLCKKVLANRNLAAELLPAQAGFFFGSTEYDEYYFKDLEDTVKILENIEQGGEYQYQASW